MLGLDPRPASLWPGIAGGSPDAAAAVLAHCRAVIDAVAPACVAIKPQLACFERLGPPGGGVLAAVVRHAHQHGLLVIADGKRGDIDVTAAAYAQALYGGFDTPFGAIAGLGADLATLNPLHGARHPRTLPHRRPRHRRRCASCSCAPPTPAPPTSSTSLSPTAAPSGSASRNWCTSLAASRWGRAVSATSAPSSAPPSPQYLPRARELMPHTVFLLPGVGAQGGRVEDLGPAFAPGPAGGLIAASRSIVSAHLDAGGEPAAAALAEAERLRAAAWALRRRLGRPLLPFFRLTLLPWPTAPSGARRPRKADVRTG